MLPRRPASCRAVHWQRQSVLPSESVWISDDLLLGTFQQFFAGSRRHRRHGSFVPGPLECRRRTGKRRMAYASDPMAPLFGNRDLGGWLGNMKELSWRWRPPTTALERAEGNDIVIRLPRWLAGWVLGPDTTPDIAAALTQDQQSLPKDTRFTRERLLVFHQALLHNEGKREEACLLFNHYLQQSLTIGAVEENLLYEAMSFVNGTVQQTFLDSATAASQKLAFCQAIWDGLSSCKIIPLSDFQPSTMNRYLTLISELPMSGQSKALVYELLNALSGPQLEGMASGFLALIKSWSSSWKAKASDQNYENLLLGAQNTVESAVIDSGILLRRLEAMTHKTGEGLISGTNLTSARKVIYSARSRIMAGIQAIKRCENELYPMRSSLWNVVDCLHSVSSSNIHTISLACLSHLEQIYEASPVGIWGDKANFRIIWLSFVARLPCFDHDLFIKTWKAIETKDYHIPDDLGSELIFSHMISQGLIKKDIHWMRNIFEGQASDATSKDYGSLLATLYSHEKYWNNTARYLIETLHDLGRYHCISRALATVRHHPRKFPLKLLRRTISSVALVNPRLALNIYKMYVPTRYNVEHFNPSRCPQLVFAMINDELIAPRAIWKILNIPIYENTQGKRPPRSDKPLSPAWIDLITNMAVAFSESKVRPQRVALRNVSQCLYHLHRYRVPVSGKMSRAITQAGVTREVLRRNWVGGERKRWILNVVEKGEGEHVAKEVETIVNAWNKKMEIDSTTKSFLAQQQQDEGQNQNKTLWKPL